MPDGAQENGVFLRFPGQWLDETWADASLGEAIAYNVQRWYEPGTGRYPRPDPAWRPTRIQELNHYLYVAANPLLYIDPLGLERLRVCCNEWDKQNLEAIQKRASDLQSAAINQTPVRPQPGPSPFGETNCAGQDFGKPGEPDTQNWNIGKGACADACIRAHEQYHRDLCRSRQGFAQLMAWKQGTDEAFALLQELECLKHALLRGRVEVDVDPLGPDNRMSRGHP
jgi:RHS repeat-associated protein